MVWWFRAVAFDLDGTLARDDRVAPEVVAALDDARRDRALVLVTGRVRAELDRVFPGLADHFDVVVTENGAVLHDHDGPRLLADPVEPALDAVLERKGIAFRRGQVLLEISGHDGPATVAALAQLGLDHQVVRNRGAAMVLPAGITKGSGVRRALASLGLSAHNAIAVGDAENDLSLLRAAEVGVAVADAVPSLAERADLVTARPDGAGVVEVLGGPLLRSHQRLCPPRRWVQVGSFENGTATTLPGSQARILVGGASGSGKSYFAGLLAERWLDAGYTLLVVDPEGDHAGLAERPDVHFVDVQPDARVHDCLSALGLPGSSLVLDLSLLQPHQQEEFLSRLPEAVAAERMRHGRPHWVVYDEAQAGTVPSAAQAAQTGTCLVTWHPEQLPDDLVREIDFTVTVVAPPASGGDATPARALLLSAGMTRSFRIGARTSGHVRHWHKYAATQLPPHRRFVFSGDAPERGAGSMREFVQRLLHAEHAEVQFHLLRGDFSRWVQGSLADQRLAGELAAIERDLVASSRGEQGGVEVAARPGAVRWTTSATPPHRHRSARSSPRGAWTGSWRTPSARRSRTAGWSSGRRPPCWRRATTPRRCASHAPG